ncbi:MAG: polysaccharide deacetylase family protein [Gemmatimonadaceae bacterium]
MPSDGRSSRAGAIALHVAIAAAGFTIGLAFMGVLRPGLIFIALLPVVGILALGVAFPVTGVFGRVLHRGRSGRCELALTFDDGPDATWTRPILDLLDAHGQRATFFVIGARVEKHPELLQEIARRGHEIGNHTWDHSYLTPLMHPEALTEELVRSNQLIEHLTGQRVRWFRPPVGLVSPRVVSAVDHTSMEIVCWSATARDGTRRTTINDAYQRLEPALTPGAIIVLHDARVNDARFDEGGEEPVALRVLDRLLERMHADGLRSVTLSELFAPR